MMFIMSCKSVLEPAQFTNDEMSSYTDHGAWHILMTNDSYWLFLYLHTKNVTSLILLVDAVYE